MCPLIWVISIVALLITRLISTHEPASRIFGFGFCKKAMLLGVRLSGPTMQREASRVAL